MFDWTADKKVLLGGPFEFRFVERPVPRPVLRKFVYPEWIAIMEEPIEVPRVSRLRACPMSGGLSRLTYNNVVSF